MRLLPKTTGVDYLYILTVNDRKCINGNKYFLFKNTQSLYRSCFINKTENLKLFGD